ncbi:large ATP-binding protein [Streptomyces sp. NBC_01438]|uniref:large ATP-binding protein n=1 Tax=Streptomyces sp. NBC_01438 TaxID=2903866 RepID=UPI00324378D5
MNAQNATVRPGADLVAELLGVEDFWMLNIAYRPGEPLYGAATRVIGAAHELNELHGRVARAAQAAVEVLGPVSRGEFNGSARSYVPLRSAVQQIGQLVSRQNEAHEQLNESIFAYRQLLSESNSSQVTQVKTHELDNDHGAGRDDDWTVSGDLRLRALEAVDAVELRVRQSAIYGYSYLSDGTGQRPNPEAWPETVQRLVADGLLAQDTSEGLYRPGQLLSLTPQGETALRDLRTAAPRVSAALSRSDAAAISGSDVGPSPAPATSPTAKPLRSR